MQTKIHLAAAGLAFAGLTASTLAFTGAAALDAPSAEAPRIRDIVTGPSQSFTSPAVNTSAVDGWIAQFAEADPDPNARVEARAGGQHVGADTRDVDVEREGTASLGEVEAPTGDPVGQLERLDWSACEGSVLDASINSTRRCAESVGGQVADQVTAAAEAAATELQAEVDRQRAQGEQRVERAEQQVDHQREQAEQEVADQREQVEQAADEAKAQARATVQEVEREYEERRERGEQSRECIADTPIGDLSINAVRGCMD